MAARTAMWSRWVYRSRIKSQSRVEARVVCLAFMARRLDFYSTTAARPAVVELVTCTTIRTAALRFKIGGKIHFILVL